MPEPQFTTSIYGNEVVVLHLKYGHVYRFPILSNGTVALHGSHIDSNPSAEREAGRFLFGAHDAARITLERANAKR